MRQLALAALIMAPLTALGDVAKFTCPHGITEIDRVAATAVSSSRPGETGTVALIGRNLIEVLWTYPEENTWEREIYALHLRSTMTTGRKNTLPVNDSAQKYLPSVKCSDLEIIK